MGMGVGETEGLPGTYSPAGVGHLRDLCSQWVSEEHLFGVEDLSWEWGTSGSEKPGPLQRGLQATWRVCLCSCEEEEKKCQPCRTMDVISVKVREHKERGWLERDGTGKQVGLLGGGGR